MGLFGPSRKEEHRKKVYDAIAGLEPVSVAVATERVRNLYPGVLNGHGKADDQEHYVWKILEELLASGGVNVSIRGKDDKPYGERRYGARRSS